MKKIIALLCVVAVVGFIAVKFIFVQNDLELSWKETKDKDGYVYEYEKVKTLYDSGTQPTDQLLIGKTLLWVQRATASTNGNTVIKLFGAFHAINEQSEMPVTLMKTFEFDTNYDNCLGLFARVQTTQYKVIKKNKSGTVISTTTQDIMTILSQTVRPIYIRSDATISYQYNGTWHSAKMIKADLTAPPTLASHIETAT